MIVAMRASIIAAFAFLAVAGPAWAEDCSPLADAQHEISQAGGGMFKTLSREEFLFARGVFVATPPVSPYPRGEDGMIAMFDDGTSVVVFVDGKKSCAKIMVSAPVTKLMLEIDKSI